MLCKIEMSSEQRIDLKFLVRLGKTPTETLNLLNQVCGDNAMSRVFKWHKRFKEGREELEEDPRSGRPSASRNDKNIELLRQKVRGDLRLTVRMIANELGISCERV